MAVKLTRYHPVVGFSPIPNLREIESVWDKSSSQVEVGFSAIDKSIDRLNALAAFSSPAIKSISASATLDYLYRTILVDASGGDVVLTLPTTIVPGFAFTVLTAHITKNLVTVKNAAGTTIDVLGGNQGVSNMVVMGVGAAWRMISLYDIGEFTVTYTGMNAAVTAEAGYERNNRVVNLEVPAKTGTSNSIGFTITGLPSFLIPVADRQTAIDDIVDNGVDHIGNVFVNHGSGLIQLYFRTSLTVIAGATYTNGGTKGLNAPFSVSYVK